MRFGLLCTVTLAMLLAGGGGARAADDATALVDALGAPSFDARETAQRALVQLGDGALPALEKAATSPDPEVRWRAAVAVRMIRWAVTPELAAQIGDLLDEFDTAAWSDRERTVQDVAAVGGPAALPFLARVLERETNDRVRRAAALELVGLGPEGLLAIEESGADILGLPKDDPYLHVLIGNGFLEDGQYERAAAEYGKALELAPESQLAWYNLACALSRLERVPEAVAALRKAIEHGYDEPAWMRSDPDLDNLREDPAFGRLVEDLEQRFPADAGRDNP